MDLSQDTTRSLVSILMPCYNAERYIREAIDSALSQTHKNFELIIIDAESTDGSVGIIESYKDPRIRLIRHKYEPILATRNSLFKEARGDFLTFLDSDDIYLPDKIREEVKFLRENEDYAGVYCDLRYFFDGEPNKLYKHRYTFYSGDIFTELLDKLFITNTTFMMRRTVLDKVGYYNEALGMVEDWDYFLRMAYGGHKIGFLPIDLVRYRLRWDNHTRFSNQVPHQKSTVKIFENLKKQMTREDAKKYNIDHFIDKRKKRLVIVLLGQGEKKEAWATMREVGIFSPMTLFFLAPSFVLKKLVEVAWRERKKGLFIPV